MCVRVRGVLSISKSSAAFSLSFFSFSLWRFSKPKSFAAFNAEIVSANDVSKTQLGAMGYTHIHTC